MPSIDLAHERADAYAFLPVNSDKSRVKFQVYGATDVGLVRERNEDCMLVDVARGLFGVADGVGGMAGGHVASATAIAAIREALEAIPPGGTTAAPDVAALVERAHRSVREAGRHYGSAGIATTLTLAHLAGGRVRLAHVGDSFALLVRDGVCRALTREHNVESESPDITALAPFPPRYRYALTRVIGQVEPLTADFTEVALEVGDWLILATDGLTDCVELVEVAEMCAQSKTPPDAAQRLIDAALAAGGPDNITLVVVLVEAI